MLRAGDIERNELLRGSCHKGIRDAFMETERTSDKRVREGFSLKMGHLRKPDGMKWRSWDSLMWGVEGTVQEKRTDKRIGLTWEPRTTSNLIIIALGTWQEARLIKIIWVLTIKCFVHHAQQIGFYLLALGRTQGFKSGEWYDQICISLRSLLVVGE